MNEFIEYCNAGLKILDEENVADMEMTAIRAYKALQGLPLADLRSILPKVSLADIFITYQTLRAELRILGGSLTEEQAYRAADFDEQRSVCKSIARKTLCDSLAFYSKL